MVVEGIFTRDFPVIQGAVIFIVLCVLAVNLATDIVYRLVDPRAQA
jgi:peptide/nickel transport system permease protein